MITINRDYIHDNIADSRVIFQRGIDIYENGAYFCTEFEPDKGWFVYQVDGNYGDYLIEIESGEHSLDSSCDCPYPGDGCKHKVAVLLDLKDKLRQWNLAQDQPSVSIAESTEPFLTTEEIKAQALEDRQKRAKSESFVVTLDDTYKGEHLLESNRGKQYTVTLHDPQNGRGHCSCPDFQTNRMDTCKHMIFLEQELKNEKKFNRQVKKELFPFVDIYWDSTRNLPKLFCERPAAEIQDIYDLITDCFEQDGQFKKSSLADFITFINSVGHDKRVRIQDEVYKRFEDYLHDSQLAELAKNRFPSLNMIKTELYPYQKSGIKFGLYKKAVLIGDEMGLGKTLQAITLALLKRDIFDFNKVLVVTMASLKEQWKREIEKFTDEKATIVAGSPTQRQANYNEEDTLFKITNYEAVLRDVTFLSRFKPDLVILDEAQRIKNFNTKTADAVKSIPRKHSMVLTGTPLENKLEDVYSIIQFLDPNMLSPLWKFAADHFMLSREKKGKIMGYRNLDQLHDKLQSIVIRRKKEEVMSELPQEVVNNYYLDLTDKQQKIHNGYAQSLIPLLHKKFLTPMDLRRIQELLLRMRMVCDSTYLIDRKTNISPKLKELESIMDELVIQSGRKVVVFSEWTTMTFLIARQLSEANISFVELSGKVPVKKRQALIDEFSDNPACKVFLSTDAGGTGLNLQAADCVVNFELPWNPAKMNQRIGRVSRIGQKSKCINVVNLISKNSIEEKILAGIQLKTDLFKGVFDGGIDSVEFSHEKRNEMLNRLREMMDEEAIATVSESRPSDDIPEDDPHFLNPKVLQDQDQLLDYEMEEKTGEDIVSEANETVSSTESAEPSGNSSSGSVFSEQPVEKVEAVLNNGLQFIGGLMEMATGQKMEPLENDQKMITIDKQSGEVTMKFKLPGF